FFNCADCSGKRRAVKHVKEKEICGSHRLSECRPVKRLFRPHRTSEREVSDNDGAGAEPLHDRPQPGAWVGAPVTDQASAKVAFHSAIEPATRRANPSTPLFLEIWNADDITAG